MATLADEFFGLDLTTKMSFRTKGPVETTTEVTYGELVNQLSEALRAADVPAQLENAEAEFIYAVKTICSKLCNPNEQSQNQVTRLLRALREWSSEIARWGVAGRKADGQFHKNILYDLNAAIQANPLGDSFLPALKLVAHGLNARRVVGTGEAPGQHFMPTTDWARAHRSIVNPTDSVEATYYKYKGLVEVSGHVEAFNAAVRRMGIDLAFEKIENPNTGANLYNLTAARNEVWGSGNRKDLRISAESKDMVFAMANFLDTLPMSAFVREVSMWNISQYLSAVWCAAPMDEKAENRRPNFAHETLSRSAKGDFPAAAVYSDTRTSPVSRLYFLE